MTSGGSSPLSPARQLNFTGREKIETFPTSILGRRRGPASNYMLYGVQDWSRRLLPKAERPTRCPDVLLAVAARLGSVMMEYLDEQAP